MGAAIRQILRMATHNENKHPLRVFLVAVRRQLSLLSLKSTQDDALEIFGIHQCGGLKINASDLTKIATGKGNGKTPANSIPVIMKSLINETCLIDKLQRWWTRSEIAGLRRELALFLADQIHQSDISAVANAIQDNQAQRQRPGHSQVNDTEAEVIPGELSNLAPDLVNFNVYESGGNQPDPRGPSYSVAMAFADVPGELDGVSYLFSLKACTLFADLKHVFALKVSGAPVFAQRLDDTEGVGLTIRIAPQGGGITGYSQSRWNIGPTGDFRLYGTHVGVQFLVAEGLPPSGSTVSLECNPSNIIVQVPDAEPITNHDAKAVAQKWLQKLICTPPVGSGSVTLSSKEIV
jgi:hypothetical protein